MSLKEKLVSFLSSWEISLLPSSYDVVGDIAIIKIPKEIEHRTQEIATTIMQYNKHIRTVLRQVSPIAGDYRLRTLAWEHGENKTKTIHREADCLFKVDLAKCYFSPRLSHERMRIARLVKPSEIVVNMFAGIGCFSLILAKFSKAKKVYSIDISPTAVQYMKENIRLNRVGNVVTAIEGDAEDIIKKRFANVADRVLMPLPKKAHEYLDSAVMALKSNGGIIHYYDFQHALREESPIEKIRRKVEPKLAKLSTSYEVLLGKIVRSVGPRWFQIVLDIFVHKKFK